MDLEIFFNLKGGNNTFVLVCRHRFCKNNVLMNHKINSAGFVVFYNSKERS